MSRSNAKLGSFVVRDLGHMLESNSVHIRTVEIVTFPIKCEVLNVKTEVKSFKSVNKASHDTGPSEFKQRKRFYRSYVYSA